MSALELTIDGGRRLSGELLAPPDKSISHRALILAALGTGRTRIEPLSGGADNRSTLAAIVELGAQVEVDEAKRIAWITGAGGPMGLKPPSGPIDCRNSGTTMRVLSGVIAGSSLSVTLTGDESLTARPMKRLRVLEKMGARLEGVERHGGLYPPITVHGAGPALTGADVRLEIASAQIKTALILAALWARGRTRVHEPARSRDHTERMLRALGARIEEEPDGTLAVDPLEKPWSVPVLEVAPDISSAAFLLAAGLVTASEDLVVETGVNPTRTGFLDVLRAFGAGLDVEPLPDRGGEPVARIRVRGGYEGLRGATVRGELTLRAIDEVPLIAAVAAFARGRTVIDDAEELRVKESDRLRATAELLRAFGAEVTETERGLIVEGDPGRLRPAAVQAGHDHRIALTAAVLGLGLPGRTVVRGAEIIDVSYPEFTREIARLGASATIG